MTTVAGLTILLGADAGSAMVVGVLSLDLSWAEPLLIVAGVAAFLRGQDRQIRQIGRILIGVALLLVSLRMIATAVEPLGSDDAVPILLDYLQTDPVSAFIIGALFTWLLHSSIAAVLLIVAFSHQDLLSPSLAVSLMLGANLGAGLIAVGLTRGAEAPVRRIPLGNLLFRGFGSVAALIALLVFNPPLGFAGSSTSVQIVNLHLAFNVLLAAVCLPLTAFAGGLIDRLVTDPLPEPRNNLTGEPSALDQAVVHMPSLALPSATRELLRMSRIVEMMLKPILELYQSGDRARIRGLRRLDDEVNEIHSAIKLYLAETIHSDMDESEARRAEELTNFAINLEQIGDILARNLARRANVISQSKLVFSNEGWKELTELHGRVLTTMQLALNVLISRDPELARQLVEAKEKVRDLERKSNWSHMQRLQRGRSKSIETSDLHLETTRALELINSLFASIAYPILAETGDLPDSGPPKLATLRPSEAG